VAGRKTKAARFAETFGPGDLLTLDGAQDAGDLAGLVREWLAGAAGRQ
jgi:hypothetical protein